MCTWLGGSCPRPSVYAGPLTLLNNGQLRDWNGISMCRRKWKTVLVYQTWVMVELMMRLAYMWFPRYSWDLETLIDSRIFQVRHHSGHKHRGFKFRFYPHKSKDLYGQSIPYNVGGFQTPGKEYYLCFLIITLNIFLISHECYLTQALSRFFSM